MTLHVIFLHGAWLKNAMQRHLSHFWVKLGGVSNQNFLTVFWKHFLEFTIVHIPPYLIEHLELYLSKQPKKLLTLGLEFNHIKRAKN